METTTVGKVLVAAKVENIEDLFKVQHGDLPADQVRKVEVADALVDTGAVYLSVPKSLITHLGLQPFATRKIRTSGGVVSTNVYGPVRLTVQGRLCNCDLLEVPDDCPVLIGQVPLELLDLVVNPVAGTLIGNPEHGGEHMADMF